MSRSTTRTALVTGLTLGTAAAVIGLGAGAASAETTELSAPTVAPNTVVAGKDSTIVISGSGCSEAPGGVEADAYAYFEVGQDVEVNGTQTNDDGTWEFDLSVWAEVPPGVYPVQAVCDLYTHEVDYPVVNLTVVAPETATPAPVTTTPNAGNGWGTPTTVLPTGNVRGTQANTAGVASPDQGAATGDSAAPGRKVVKVLTGFKPKEVVTVTLHSTPQTVGTFTADANGTVTVEFTVPAGTPTGAHTLVYEGNMGTYFQESLTVAAATSNASSASLAYTGADVALPLGLGVGALALGGGLVFAARRRSAEGSQA
jgi:hypothetical protein